MATGSTSTSSGGERLECVQVMERQHVAHSPMESFCRHLPQSSHASHRRATGMSTGSVLVPLSRDRLRITRLEHALLGSGVALPDDGGGMSTTDMGVGSKNLSHSAVKSSAEKGTSGDEPPSSTVLEAAARRASTVTRHASCAAARASASGSASKTSNRASRACGKKL